MFLGKWNIDDYLTFPANTHAATAAATDADSVPSYRIYEDETATAILTGTMARLDAANTTGFYTERIQLTAANGFEVGKTYTVYIAATVSSVEGTNSHTFGIEKKIANAVWDEVLTAATHNVASSAGRRLRQLTDSIVHSGTSQGAGANGNQIILDTGASATDGTYDPSIIFITAGTGAGQSRRILEYKGSTRTATVNRTWKVLPDATSQFVIVSDAGGLSRNEGLAQAGAASTVTLNALAASVDDAYNGQVVYIVSGTGEDQARIVTDYDGTTKVATVNRPWDTTPDTTSCYEMLPILAFDPNYTVAEDNGAGTTWTWTEMQRIIFAIAAGERSGGGLAGNKNFKIPGGTKTRASIPTDTNGNTTGSVMLDGSDV